MRQNWRRYVGMLLAVGGLLWVAACLFFHRTEEMIEWEAEQVHDELRQHTLDLKSAGVPDEQLVGLEKVLSWQLVASRGVMHHLVLSFLVLSGIQVSLFGLMIHCWDQVRQQNLVQRVFENAKGGKEQA